MTNDRMAGILGGSEEDWAEYDRDNEELYVDEFHAKYHPEVPEDKRAQRVREELATDTGTEISNRKRYAGIECLICYREFSEGDKVLVYKRKRIFPFNTRKGRMCPEHKSLIE